MREHPENNLLDRLVETETNDGKLTDQEVLSFCGLLPIAGETIPEGALVLPLIASASA